MGLRGDGVINDCDRRFNSSSHYTVQTQVNVNESSLNSINIWNVLTTNVLSLEFYKSILLEVDSSRKCIANFRRREFTSFRRIEASWVNQTNYYWILRYRDLRYLFSHSFWTPVFNHWFKPSFTKLECVITLSLRHYFTIIEPKTKRKMAAFWKIVSCIHLAIFSLRN